MEFSANSRKQFYVGVFAQRFMLTLVFFTYSCKTKRTLTTNSSSVFKTDTLQVQLKDRVSPITQQVDTLPGLSEEVEIQISGSLPDTVIIMGVGDIMMGTNFPNESYLPSDTGRYLWKEVAPILRSADITFGNLEGVILNEGGQQKKCNNPKLCYLFRTPEYLAKNFIDCEFDLMSIANNHANDFGKTGRISTQKVLDSLKIGHAGSIEQPFTIKNIGYLKVGFCAFAPNKGTASIHQTENIKSIIQHLDSLSDIVIASFHAGAEGSEHRHVTRKKEYYYGEDRGDVFELAHLMIDLGADVVFGHGPHVVRAIEVYQNKMIAYSLGNFLTYGRFNLEGYAGEAPILELRTDTNGKFLSGQIHSFRQHYNLGPGIDPNFSSLKTIQQLSLGDFPENPIFIDDNGSIQYLEK